MILEPQHSHSENQQSKQETVMDSNEKNLTIFDEIKNQSIKLSGQFSHLEVFNARKNREEKVYLSYSDNPAQYLAHFLNNHSKNTTAQVKQLMQTSQYVVLEKIVNNQKYQVNIKPSLRDIRQSIKGKIAEMKSGINHLDENSNRKNQSHQFTNNYMEFRRKGYWNQKSQKKENVKEFLHKMKIMQSKQRKKYQKSLKKQKELQKQQEQQKIIQLEQQKKKLYAYSIERSQKTRNKRQEQNENQKKKKKQISQFLSKYRTAKPIYIQNQQKFNKNYLDGIEEYRSNKIREIKNSRQSIEFEQIQKHIQDYENYKEKLEEEHEKKQKEEAQMLDKLQQELKLLYHSKFHEELLEKQRESVGSESKEFRKKITQYSQNIRGNFKPTINSQKRMQLQQKIKELQLLEDKTKIKRVLGGKTIFQNKPNPTHRKKGMQYLTMLRQLNEGKPRKKASMQPRSLSLMELNNNSKPLRIDYLRQNRPKVSLKYTLSSWKKVLDDQKYTPKDKYISVMNHVSALEIHAHQKQTQLRNTKNPEKAMNIKQEVDKYYLQSVAAKMVVLKDVILKQ